MAVTRRMTSSRRAREADEQAEEETKLKKVRIEARIFLATINLRTCPRCALVCNDPYTEYHLQNCNTIIGNLLGEQQSTFDAGRKSAYSDDNPSTPNTTSSLNNEFPPERSTLESS